MAAIRDADSPWASKTVGAPRSKLPSVQFPKAPTAPANMNAKLVLPAGKHGPRQNYSQPNVSSYPENSLGNNMASDSPPTIQ